MKLPDELKDFTDHALERYKAVSRRAGSWNARFQLFKSLYEGYQYEDDDIGVGKSRIKDVQQREQARNMRGPNWNHWRFRVNDNIIQEVVDYFLVDYIVTDPDWDMEPISDDSQAKFVAKAMNRVIEYVKEINEFGVQNLESGLLTILTGTTYYHVYEEEETGEVGIGYKPYDGVIDDGEALDLELSDYLIIPHDMPLPKFKAKFEAKYKEMFGDESPYTKYYEANNYDINYSLADLYGMFDAARTYAQTRNTYKVRVLEVLTYDGQQIFFVQTGVENFDPVFLGESPYPMRYPYVRNRFKASALSGQGTTWLADLIEVQNAVNYLTNAAVNNTVEQANLKIFTPRDVIYSDQDGETDVIGVKTQHFKFIPSPTYDGPIMQYVQAPAIAIELVNQRDALIQRTYTRLNITPAARGLLPASRTSAKSLEFMVNQRNNQSQPYMVLFKNSLQRLAVKIIQMAKDVYSEDKLLEIVGQDSLYGVREFKKYIPDAPTVKIVAGTEVDLTAADKEAKLQYILQYGGLEAFDNEDLMTLFGLNKDENLTTPADRWRGQALIQISDILAGEEIPKTERGQNHLVFIQEINELKSTKQWENASDEIKAQIEEFEKNHYIAYEQDVQEKQIWSALGAQRAQALATQLGLGQPATAPGVVTEQPMPQVAGQGPQVAPTMMNTQPPVGEPAPMVSPQIMEQIATRI